MLMRNLNTSDNNAKASGSASRQAQQAETIFGQDGSGRSGVGAVIGVSDVDYAGSAGVGAGSQGSYHTRWTKRRVQTVRISPQITTPTQPSTNSQVLVTETRNVDGREMVSVENVCNRSPYKWQTSKSTSVAIV
ncbi:hypothetical protein Tco_1537995 [Tanacetum coccineum]